MEEDGLRQFVRGLIEKKGAGDEEALLAELDEKIDDALVGALSDEALDKFVGLVESGNEVSDEAVEQIVAESGMDRDAVIKQVLMDFHDDVMAREMQGKEQA